jgi:ABC-type amino acid transport substrate-binding protein
MWRNSLTGRLAGACALLLITVLAQADSMNGIRERGALRVAVYKDFAPFSYLEGGRYRGIDVDLAGLLAERLGVALDLMPIGADENMGDDLRNAIWKGHYLGGGVADLMMHVPFDPDFARDNDRARLFAPYFREQMALAFDPGRVANPDDPLALAEVPVGVELDSIGDYYVSSAFGGRLRDSAVHFRTPAEAFAALRAGELGAVLAPRAQAEAALADAGDSGLRISLFSLRGMLRSYWDVGLAIKSGNPELLEELRSAMLALHEGDVLAEVVGRYGVSYVAPTAPVSSVAPVPD